MRSSVKVAGLERIRSPFLAVVIGEASNKKLPVSLRALDAMLDGELARTLASGDFTGKLDQTAVLYPKRGPKRVVLVGAGKPAETSRAVIRRCAAVAARRAVALNVSSMSIHITDWARGGVTPTEIGQVVVEGVSQGAWQFTEYQDTDQARTPIGSLDIIVNKDDRSAAEKGCRAGAGIASGQELARALQALPGNVCTPKYLADVARDLGKTHGFAVRVLGPSQISREGLRALQAVALGSEQEPRFIVLKHDAGGNSAPLCFIGKGVTFDSGGISIKPSASMENMKYDMSGAASVLGLFETLGNLRPKLNVVGLIPATENLPSGTALKPGDIVKSHLGKYIEVVNTDAEGRLILCDALSYARRYKPACVVDVATLTGAIVVGLGPHAVGLFGNDESLVEEVRWAGELAGERCWELPLWSEYRDLIKSDVADVKNSGGRAAGSISAAWFLREFVDGFPWAHLDIAGTAYLEAERPDMPKGPTGIGVRLLAQFIIGRAQG